MTWEVAQQFAVNRGGWRRHVAQCVLTRDELCLRLRKGALIGLREPLFKFMTPLISGMDKARILT